MIPEAMSDIPLLQPVTQDYARGRQAVVLIEVFCCMEEGVPVPQEWQGMHV